MYRILEFNDLGDKRGGLVAIEGAKNIPFEIKRVYYIFDTAEGVRRGYHAHRKLKQVIVAISGGCKFALDDGKERVEVLLNDPRKGLYLEGTIWREMVDFTRDCVLLALADDYYDENDYIRDYQKFMQEVSQ
jgi:dTDP-4-dehydrorhamnose 3,5-epimerase-like enzyme